MKKQNKISSRFLKCWLLVALLVGLSGCAAGLEQNLDQSEDARWGLAYLDSALPALLSASKACNQAANPRFFEVLAGDYQLGLGQASLNIIGRGSWGAGPVIPEGRSWKAYPAQASVCNWYQRITVHHTHSLYTIQSLQKFHQTQKDPKADIGYHFFIDTDGLVYEARPLGFMGSHSEADNGQNVGIVLNGDFSEKLPDPRQLASLKQLLKALRCPCAPLEGVFTHQQRKSLKFPGQPEHYTACPGDFLALEVYGFAKELGLGPVTR